MVRREILDQNRNVLDTAAELFRQRIQSFFGNLDEIFALHPSAQTHTAHSHRIASVVLLIVFTLVIFIFIVPDVSFLFLFVLFLFWLFA